MVVLMAAALVLTQGAQAAEKKKKSRIDKSEAKATATAPESTQVEKVTFAYDPNLPRYVVVVESFDYSASGEMSGADSGTPAGGIEASGESYTVLDDGRIQTSWSSSAGPAIGKGMSKQLMTALSGWPNVVLVEPDAIQKNGDGTYALKLQPGEVGPFIIRGTVTEFVETAEAESSGKGFDSRKLGLAAGLVGAITGERGVAAAGAGVAIAGPEFKKAKMKRTGMVGMDLRIIDGRTARITPGGSFDCQGSFTTISAGSDFSVLGISGGGSEMAASSLGQATRAALNDALVKAHDSLSNVRQ
jgi:curli biogenesis system outer membrane secretion channel CsgG